ncbi:ankyrin repeat domain-containing protein 1-like [Procambarus clarkii]|uniref:ankyrin repeat domain-containing protein 1-like n=1 Tax=Procambarus clarkii TaxID=6728 RepID=UPI003744257B
MGLTPPSFFLRAQRDAPEKKKKKKDIISDFTKAFDKCDHGVIAHKMKSMGITGRTALHYAAAYGHDNTVKVFLDAGANINATDNNSSTALYWAAAGGHDNTVKVLLDAGADVNAEDNDITAESHVRLSAVTLFLCQSQ